MDIKKNLRRTQAVTKIVLFFEGYGECHNTEEVIGQIGYDADADVENTADSVFCSHGAGTIVRGMRRTPYACRRRGGRKIGRRYTDVCSISSTEKNDRADNRKSWMQSMSERPIR